MTLRSINAAVQGQNVALSSLKGVIDAGDSGCYSGSGQLLTDLSGNGQNFYRGISSSVEANPDPTFQGTAGNLSISESFISDGTQDVFRSAVGTPTWAANMHKDSAKFAILGMGKVKGSLSAGLYIMKTLAVSTGTGIAFSISALTVALQVRGGGVLQLNQALTPPWNTAGDQYFVAGCIYDEAAGAGTLFCNGKSATFSATYPSPSSGAPSGSFELFGNAGAGIYPPAGDEYAGVAVWADGTLPTLAEFFGLYNELGLRLGIAPEPRVLQPISEGIPPEAAGFGSLDSGLLLAA